MKWCGQFQRFCEDKNECKTCVYVVAMMERVKREGTSKDRF